MSKNNHNTLYFTLLSRYLPTILQPAGTKQSYNSQSPAIMWPRPWWPDNNIEDLPISSSSLTQLPAHARSVALRLTGVLSVVPPVWWQRMGLLVLVLWLSASSARLIWMLVAPAPDFVVKGESVNLPLLASQPENVGVDIEQFATLNPFGQATESAPIEQAPPAIEDEAQETRLKLQLMGVFATGGQDKDMAIIANGASQSLYAVGDALPGGANVKLSKVLPDRVLLENNGRFELLWLYDESNRSKPQPEAEPAPMRASAKISRDVATKYANAKDLTAENLAEVVRISMKRQNGELIGFEVRPGRDRSVFDTMGLQAGDIVTAVNGTRLTDQRVAIDVARSLRSARSATLTLLRNGQEQDLEVSLE